MRYTILAPHVDDEVVGCYRLLDAGEVDAVYYGFELSDTRWKEAEACAKRFGFQPYRLFGRGSPHASPLEIPSVHTLLVVPHIKDHHPDHKKVSRYARHLHYPKKYYSVDMNVEMEALTPEFQRDKKAALIDLFPSQKELFLSDQKYYLFETLLDSEYDEVLVIDEKGEERRVSCKLL